MKKSKTTSGLRTATRVGRSLVVILALLMNMLPVAPLAKPAHAASPPYVPLDGFVTNTYDVWQPTTSSWVNGLATGYAEGETAAFSLKNNPIPVGYYYLTACFNYIGANGAYAFTDLEPYNTTETVTLRGGSIQHSLDGVSTDNAAATVTYVTSLAKSAAPCATNDFGFEIGLNITSAISTNWYIYYGGHLAAPGDTTALGDTVQPGLGVAAWPTGNFQAYLKDVTGNKTLPFKSSLIARAITVNKLVDTDGNGTVDLVGGTNNDPLLAGYTIVPARLRRP